jgi:hypothetical protein
MTSSKNRKRGNPAKVVRNSLDLKSSETIPSSMASILDRRFQAHSQMKLRFREVPLIDIMPKAPLGSHQEKTHTNTNMPKVASSKLGFVR